MDLGGADPYAVAADPVAVCGETVDWLRHVAEQQIQLVKFGRVCVVYCFS